ncbi:MAG: H-NS histone family protein [Inhella sp.]|jgi:DNA-binding protein H-NS|uniref:H-NS histone family protein n=1 Tax=Inhella sp. TaxID=1921806 RepID=UPI0022BE7AC5|nr:H-NS histone family protein [Inhella sp.]MCZ8234622.1 H-NS histone family protein [Inhella sp.]
MASLQELMAQRAALDQQIEETKNRDRSAAIAQIKSLMAQFGISAADLSGRTRAAAKPTGKVPAKYRNKATGETWSGRGLQPKWLKAALAGGAQLQDFAV